MIAADAVQSLLFTLIDVFELHGLSHAVDGIGPNDRNASTGIAFEFGVALDEAVTLDVVGGLTLFAFEFVVALDEVVVPDVIGRLTLFAEESPGDVCIPCRLLAMLSRVSICSNLAITAVIWAIIVVSIPSADLAVAGVDTGAN